MTQQIFVPPQDTLTEEAVLARLNLREIWLPEKSRNRPGGRWEKLSITIHETDNPRPGADALAHSAYMNSEEARARRVSWHYTVDDKIVVKHLPVTEAAFHCGVQEGNRHSIGIELCVAEDMDWLQTLDRAALLCGYLWKQMGILRLRQHWDWNRKRCPSRIRQGRLWSAFSQQTRRYYARMRW